MKSGLFFPLEKALCCHAHTWKGSFFQAMPHAIPQAILKPVCRREPLPPSAQKKASLPLLPYGMLYLPAPMALQKKGGLCDFCNCLKLLLLFSLRGYPLWTGYALHGKGYGQSAAHKVCQHLLFPLWQGESAFCGQLPAFQEIGHIPGQGPHGLQAFQVLPDLLGTGPVHHVPVLR